MLRLVALFGATVLIVIATVGSHAASLRAELLEQRRRLGAISTGRTPEERAKAARELRIRRLAASDRPEERARLHAAARAEGDIASSRFAIEEISERPVPADAGVLRWAVNHPAPAASLAAHRGLVRLGSIDEAFPSLVARARTGAPGLAGLGLRRAAKSPSDYHPRAIDYCLAVTRVADIAVRVEAVDGLMLFGRRDLAMPILREMLAGETATERMNAAHVLGLHLDAPGVRALLEAHKDDPDEFVRQAVAEALAGKSGQ